MKWLHGARHASRKQEAPSLPETFSQALALKRFGAIQDEVRHLLTANPAAAEFEWLRDEVRRLAWPAPEIAKLEAYGHYYRGALGPAFAQASPFCGGTNGMAFDEDLFILAILCLINNAQYEDAYRLLAVAANHEAILAKRVDYHNIKSAICLACGRLHEAKASLDNARQVDPGDPLTAFNAYALHFELGDMPAFMQLERDIAAGRYGDDGNAFILATCELARDRYAAGFEILERRYDQGDAARHVNPALPAELRWRERGLDLPQDATLLITCEQGFGDTIMMARYFPQVWERLGGRLLIETQPEALALLRHNFPAIPFLAREHGKRPTATFDYWIGSMSLPYVCGSEPGMIPWKVGYLTAPPEHRDYWARRVNELSEAGQARIGLAWSGNPAHRSDRRRSIPFTQLAPFLASWADVRFFALQTFVPSPHPAVLVDVAEELVTLADTTALIAEMDLIITVDTSIVHLAGAMGRLTWLLLPHRYEWRWGLEGEGNHWYDSVRVLRQKTHGDWDGLLTEVMGSRLPDFLQGLPMRSRQGS